MSQLELCTLETGSTREFLDVADAAFGFHDVFERYLELDSSLEPGDTLLGRVDGRTVTALQIFTKRIRLGPEEILVGGIGSVGTHPDFERRGLSTALLGLAIDTMRERGMAVSLLFTGRTSFYARLGWHVIPYPVWVLRGRGRSPAAPGRPFRSEDLTAARGLYESYCGRRAGTTVRSEAYWNDQLRYAGSPEEEFTVNAENGRISAYVRTAELYGMRRVIEYARAPGAEAPLARLLSAEGTNRRPAFAQVACDDDALERELGRAGPGPDRVDFPDAMWRVLDRARLARIARLPESASDEHVLEALLGEGRGLYWTSDRF